MVYPRVLFHAITSINGRMSYLKLLLPPLTSDCLLPQPLFALFFTGSRSPLLGILDGWGFVTVAFLRQALGCSLGCSSSLPVEPICLAC